MPVSNLLLCIFIYKDAASVRLLASFLGLPFIIIILFSIRLFYISATRWFFSILFFDFLVLIV